MKLLELVPWLSLLVGLTAGTDSPYWTYTCDEINTVVGGHLVGSRCIKEEANSENPPQSLEACKLTCGSNGVLWPKPTGSLQLSKTLTSFLPQGLVVSSITAPGTDVKMMVEEFLDIFKEYLYMKHPDYEGNNVNPFPKNGSADGDLQISITVDSGDVAFTTETDESYSLELTSPQGKREKNTVTASIQAATYYGARHALETLSQMIGFDDLANSLLVYNAAKVTDQPVYPHRGILVDTSRNYIKVDTIKRIISAMSYDKLNVFHWHITDTHSFPLVSKRVPQLTRIGAYTQRQVYTEEDIKSIVQYAKVRGVRVLPEFDAPAHVGNGWQFGEKEGLGRLAVCVNQEPWQDYCVEPPCGQLNPVNPNVYTTLGDLYKDFFDLFSTDFFHMGGDEVNLNCWNASEEVREYLESNGQIGTEDELVKLWDNFQKQAAEKVYSAAGGKLPLILWTSRLTEKGEVDQYLSNEDYIIQIWTTGDDSVISELINKGYRVIFSNYDAWYFDCGYSGWVTDGNNWCSPYKGWQLAYDNSPRAMYRAQGGSPDKENLILGGEAAMWAEQVDSAAILHKLWPRASAVAERLWGEPEGKWKEAEIRMVSHRRDMLGRGVQSDALQPEWCNQNEALCYVRT